MNTRAVGMDEFPTVSNQVAQELSLVGESHPHLYSAVLPLFWPNRLVVGDEQKNIYSCECTVRGVTMYKSCASIWRNCRDRVAPKSKVMVLLVAFS